MASPFQQLFQAQTLIQPLQLEGRVGGVSLGVYKIRKLDNSHLASCVIASHTLHHEGCPFWKVNVLYFQCLEYGLVAHDVVDIGSLNKKD